MAIAQATEGSSYGVDLSGHEADNWLEFLERESNPKERHVFCTCGETWLYSRFGPHMDDCPSCNPEKWNKT
jgi:hypothetical protein